MGTGLSDPAAQGAGFAPRFLKILKILNRQYPVASQHKCAKSLTFENFFWPGGLAAARARGTQQKE